MPEEIRLAVCLVTRVSLCPTIIIYCFAINVFFLSFFFVSTFYMMLSSLYSVIVLGLISDYEFSILFSVCELCF